MTSFLCILFSYFIGSFSSAVIVCKTFGLGDPRYQGSNNPGTTNVLRIGGKKIALIVLIADILKGIIPIWIGQLLHVTDTLLVWIGFFAFLGHIYPIFFHFKGGKGVATGIGVILALSPLTAFFIIITWLIIALITRYSSLAAITSTLLTPIYAFFFMHKAHLIGISLLCLILLIKHWRNIHRLIQGTESKIKFQKNKKHI
ncbi:MAG: putative glycerol-3-phosphate acyltransferase [Legionellaceae bacterium]